MTNFIIYGLGRSRTYWLSKFLTYKDHTCNHEVALTFRTPGDYKTYFSNPNIGASETGVAQGHWLIDHACPGIKNVVVNRPVEEVLTAMLEIDLSGVAHYDVETLRRHLNYGRRMLDQISEKKDTLVVNYHDLNQMEVCRRVFEHCLPYEFDIKWWGGLKNKNLQISLPEKLMYYTKHKDEILNFKKLCKLELIKLRHSEPNNPIWN